MEKRMYNHLRFKKKMFICIYMYRLSLEENILVTVARTD